MRSFEIAEKPFEKQAYLFRISLLLIPNLLYQFGRILLFERESTAAHSVHHYSQAVHVRLEAMRMPTQDLRGSVVHCPKTL